MNNRLIIFIFICIWIVESACIFSDNGDENTTGRKIIEQNLKTLEVYWKNKDLKNIRNILLQNGKIYLKLSSKGGYFSKSQALGVIQKYFANKEILKFKFLKSDAKKRSSNIYEAVEVYKIDNKKITHTLEFFFVIKQKKIYILGIKVL